MTRVMIAIAVLLTGCSPEPAKVPASNVEVVENAAPRPNPTPTAPAAPTGRASQYTDMDKQPCKLIENNEQEGGYFRSSCPGMGGYSYELVESDLRQSLVMIAPGGKRSKLAFGRIGGGGFSHFGKTFDWRGEAGSPPDRLTVRYNVQQGEGAGDTAYLVVIKLAAPSCIVGLVEPQPGQSDKARALADRDPAPTCLPDFQ